VQEKTHTLTYLWYPDARELPSEDRELLERAREVTAHAYAPYSAFHVGAALRLTNREIISGTNQENASFPAGLCAERVALSTASSVHPGMAVAALAVSYDNVHGSSQRPISPCGICRQSLVEYEKRGGGPIRVILGGLEGEVWVVPSAAALLPFSFSAADLRG
jgi:cytidine deaminase